MGFGPRERGEERGSFWVSLGILRRGFLAFSMIKRVGERWGLFGLGLREGLEERGRFGLGKRGEKRGALGGKGGLSVLRCWFGGKSRGYRRWFL